YTLTQLAPEVSCADWLKTPNNDKNLTGTGLPSFSIPGPAVVYVLYDTRIALANRPLPAWLTSNFQYTHRLVDITESDPDQEFALYAKAFPAGTVNLGGNSAPPALTDTPRPNYAVAVAPDTAGDGGPDVVDNCPNVANTGQLDTDLDGPGDACDPPFDSFGYRLTVDGGPDGPAYQFQDISGDGTAITLAD